jgi:hypothetical protein
VVHRDERHHGQRLTSNEFRKEALDMNLLTSSKITRVSNAAAVGNSDTLTSDIIDTSGLSDVAFIVQLGGTVGTGTVKLQQSATNATNAMVDVAGSSYAFTNAVNKLVLVESIDPSYRYQRVAVVRDTNSNTILDGIIAVQGKSGLEPITQGTTVASTTLLTSPSNS